MPFDIDIVKASVSAAPDMTFDNFIFDLFLNDPRTQNVWDNEFSIYTILMRNSWLVTPAELVIVFIVDILVCCIDDGGYIVINEILIL